MKKMIRLPFPAPRHLLPAGAVVLALSGCASVGRYPVHDPAVAAQYGRGDATLNAPADGPRSSLDTPGRDIRQDTWWTGFGDERLDRLVAQALAANSDLAAAGLAVQRSRLQAGLASNALWIAWGAHDRAYALIALQLGLAVMNVRGVRNNDGES